MAKKRVLITGGGYLAGQLVDNFDDAYDLRLVDVVDTAATATRPAVAAHDLTDPDISGYDGMFKDVDSVVHLAYKNPGGIWGNAIPPLDRFPIEMENIQMAFNVLRCAHAAGVRRVLIASSNATTSWTEQNRVHTRKQEIIDPAAAPRYATFYGWAKLSYEQVGFIFANGDIGRKMDVINMRIGAPHPVPLSEYNGDRRRFKRDLGAYVSPRDFTQFVVRGIETEDITDADGMPFFTGYAVSDNTRRFWSIENARRVLGFHPEDDSEVIWAEDVRTALTLDAQSPGRVGHTPSHA